MSLLILASASPRRAALLQQIGLVPDLIVAPEIDETPKARELPRAYALRMAKEKAAAAWNGLAEGERAQTPFVLAADTVVSLGRRILPKAHDMADVVRCLTLLSGRRHTVITAVALLRDGVKPKLRRVETKVQLRRLLPAEIKTYAMGEEGLGKAGGYAIQGQAAVFIKAINGSYTNVVGLPLNETHALLTGAGFPARHGTLTHS
ncbi:MAG TPA: septum formation protein Maf [Alphaproteobacteria bacterium]|nr:septum formation protein Maf [Alphaproteobacteria bacterium]